jgi:uncharacterized protein (UPF0335 family)
MGADPMNLNAQCESVWRSLKRAKPRSKRSNRLPERAGHHIQLKRLKRELKGEEDMTDTPQAGHNSEPAAQFAAAQLQSIIERIERLEEERKAIGSDITDIFAEAKSNGFDKKALRTIIRLRKQDASERQEEETILETYMRALGML